MRSIRTRLLWSLVIGSVVVLLLGGSGLYWFIHHTLLRQQDRLLESRAQSIAQLVSFSNGRMEFEQDETITNASSDMLFRIEDLQGNILRQSPSLKGINLNETLTKSATQLAVPTFHNVILSADDDARAISMMFEPQVEAENESEGESARPPKLLITVAAFSQPIDKAMTVLVSALSVIGFLVIGTIVVVLWLGIRFALMPLDQLSTGLRHMDAISPEPIPTPSNCPSELQPVYAELDRLIVRIRSAMEWEHLFTDAVAHELRTPLAELRTVTEVAERWPEDKQLIRAVGEARLIGNEMGRMVEALLNMTRSRMMKKSAAEETTQLAPLAQRIWSELKNTAGSRHLHPEVSFDPQAVWHISPDIAELVFRNLIDNAIIHTPREGIIRLQVISLPNGDAELVVENQPVDLTPEDVKHLTWPFWRKDSARSDRTHVGLGLSVVKRLTEAVGLDFTPSLNKDNQTLTIRIAPSTINATDRNKSAAATPSNTIKSSTENKQHDDLNQDYHSVRQTPAPPINTTPRRTTASVHFQHVITNIIPQPLREITDSPPYNVRQTAPAPVPP